MSEAFGAERSAQHDRSPAGCGFPKSCRAAPYGWFVPTYPGEQLAWHSGWAAEAGTSSLLLLVPGRRMAFVVLANGEGVWTDTPLDAAAIAGSAFARAFLDGAVFAEQPGH